MSNFHLQTQFKKKKQTQKRFPRYHVHKSGTDWLPALKTEPRGRCYSWNRGIKIVMELLTTQSVANLEWKGHKRYRQFFFFPTVASFQSVSWCFEHHEQSDTRSGRNLCSQNLQNSKTKAPSTRPLQIFRSRNTEAMGLSMFYAHGLFVPLYPKGLKNICFKKPSRTFTQGPTQEKCY